MAGNVPQDDSYTKGLVVLSNDGFKTPVILQGDPLTKRMLVNAAVASLPTGQGKTLLFAAITANAGTTTLVALQGVGLKIKVVSYVFTMSAAGTAKFLDDTGDLTGAMDFATQGGAVVLGQPSDHVLETTANNNLKMTTTGGNAHGHLSYIVEA